jgi:hypothetical protein
LIERKEREKNIRGSCLMPMSGIGIMQNVDNIHTS